MIHERSCIFHQYADNYLLGLVRTRLEMYGSSTEYRVNYSILCSPYEAHSPPA